MQESAGDRQIFIFIPDSGGKFRVNAVREVWVCRRILWDERA